MRRVLLRRQLQTTGDSSIRARRMRCMTMFCVGFVSLLMAQSSGTMRVMVTASTVASSSSTPGTTTLRRTSTSSSTTTTIGGTTTDPNEDDLFDITDNAFGEKKKRRYKSRFHDLEQMVLSLQQQVNQLNMNAETMGTLQQQLNDKDLAISTLQRQMMDKDNQLKSMQSKMNTNEGAMNGIMAAQTMLKAEISTILSTIVNGMNGNLRQLVQDMNKSLKGLGGITDDLRDHVQEMIHNVIQNKLLPPLNAVVDKVDNHTQQVVDRIVGESNTRLNTIITFVNTIITGLNNFKISLPGITTINPFNFNAIPKSPIPSIDFPNIDSLANLVLDDLPSVMDNLIPQLSNWPDVIMNFTLG